MRISHMASLLQTDFTTVNCCFNNSATVYTYKAPLSWGLKADDLVIVKTQAGHKSVTVVSVDDEPEIDTEQKFDYVWLVAKLDTSEYDQLVQQEQALIDELNKAKKKTHTEQAMKALGIQEVSGVEKLTRIK